MESHISARNGTSPSSPARERKRTLGHLVHAIREDGGFSGRVQLTWRRCTLWDPKWGSCIIKASFSWKLHLKLWMELVVEMDGFRVSLSKEGDLSELVRTADAAEPSSRDPPGPAHLAKHLTLVKESRVLATEWQIFGQLTWCFIELGSGLGALQSQKDNTSQRISMRKKMDPWRPMFAGRLH